MASKASPPTNVGAPNQTLYCTNLPDKLKKPDLRLALYTLFSTYGTVLDVVAMRTQKMRGQAHVVFRDLQASTQALRSLQGFDFFGKEMKIMYGKGSSDIFAKLRGTYATAGQAGVATTDLQKSIFNAPPSAAAAPPTTAATAQASAEAPTANGVAPASQGTKRPRDEEGDEGEAPMDEDESDVSMEASSDED